MKLEIAGIVAGALLVWQRVAKWIDKLSRYIQPIVEEIEKLGADGHLTNEEKKKIAVKALESLEKGGEIKLNFVTRRVALYLIDKLAQKLPSNINFKTMVTKIEEEIK